MIERTIRHAIEVAWQQREYGDIRARVWKYDLCKSGGKPTNSEFMALLTDKLRLEYRMREAC